MPSPSSLRCLVPLSKKGTFSLLQTSRVLGVQGRTIVQATANVLQGEKKYKTFDDLPGPNILTNIYWLFIRGYMLYSHDLQAIFKKKYGPIWKTALGKYKLVNVVDVEMIEHVLRHEGKYPVRNDMELWKLHRRMRDLEYGPFTTEGYRWKSLRSVLNNRLLRPDEALLYADGVNEVLTDLLIRLDAMRKDSPSGVVVHDLIKIIYRYTFEGISHILFERRIGCLDKDVPPETQKFIDSIGGALMYAVLVAIIPEWTSGILPVWKRYLGHWDYIFSFGKKLIDEKIDMIQESVDKGEEVRGEYLTYILSSGKLSPKEVYASVIELVLAGVDTTANTLTWALYALSENPEVQEELYREVAECLPGKRIPTAEDITNMRFLKAVIRETLRLYPAVPQNSRVVVDRPMVIGEYMFPEGTQLTLGHYHIAREDENFPNASKFMPQRWYREQRFKNNPYSAIPFGHGIRACIGRRIAELEMHLGLCRIIQHYELRPDPKCKNIRSSARTTLVPNKPISMQFLERP